MVSAAAGVVSSAFSLLSEQEIIAEEARIRARRREMNLLVIDLLLYWLMQSHF